MQGSGFRSLRFRACGSGCEVEGSQFRAPFGRPFPHTRVPDELLLLLAIADLQKQQTAQCQVRWVRSAQLLPLPKIAGQDPPTSQRPL